MPEPQRRDNRRTADAKKPGFEPKRTSDRERVQPGYAGEGRPSQPADELLDFLFRGVVPESWAVNGGLGTAEIKDGTLIVTNSLDVQAIIGTPIIIGP